MYAGESASAVIPFYYDPDFTDTVTLSVGMEDGSRIPDFIDVTEPLISLNPPAGVSSVG